MMELHEVEIVRNVLEDLCEMVECQSNLLSKVSLEYVDLEATTSMKELC